jgi:hypothetical protein
MYHFHVVTFFFSITDVKNIYHIFSNLIHTLFQFWRAKESYVDNNHMRIRVTVESWVVEKLCNSCSCHKNNMI